MDFAEYKSSTVGRRYPEPAAQRRALSLCLKAVEAGFDEHFLKPVEVEALSRLLADVEARKRGKA